MTYFRIMIVVGQLGKIWVKGYRAKQIFQSISAIGYFSLMMKLYSYREDQTLIIDNVIADIRFESKYPLENPYTLKSLIR